MIWISITVLAIAAFLVKLGALSVMVNVLSIGLIAATLIAFAGLLAWLIHLAFRGHC